MFFRTVFLVSLTLFLFSCATQSVTAPVAMIEENGCVAEMLDQKRTISAQSCSDLFKVEKIKTQTKLDKTIDIVKDLSPAMITEAYWDVVRQLSANANSKIKLDSDKFYLTEITNDGTRIQATYNYDSVTNQFFIVKLQYGKNGQSTDIPLANLHFFKDSELNNHIRDKINSTDTKINIKQHISYEVFEKVKDDLNNLNLFSTHELLEISKLDHKKRIAKYNFMLNVRRIKNFLTNTLLDDFVYKPARGFVISVLSIYLISSHFDVGKHLGLTKEDVPVWVAPSIVNMTAHQNKSVQKEAVVLMKLINSKSGEEAPKKALEQVKADTIKINETDFYMVKTNKSDGKTYFVLTHENEGGNLDVFFQEIDPDRFPAITASAVK